MEVVVGGADFDDVGSTFRGGDGLLAVAETVGGICTEFGEERGEVLRAADVEVGGAATGVALTIRFLHIKKSFPTTAQRLRKYP